MKFGKRLEIGLKDTASAVVRLFARTPPVEKPGPIKRVLFIRYGGIGDMILSLPVFRAARTRFTDARIDVLCDRKNGGPLTGTGLVENIYFYEKGPHRIARLVAALRKNRYDYIANLVAYPSFTFGMLARLIGPKAVRAAGDQERFAYFYNRQIDLPPKMETHMLNRLFLLSADITGPEVSAITTPWATYDRDVQDRGKAVFDNAVRSLREKSSPRLAAVNLSAGLTRREWPLGKNAEFLSTAVKKHRDRIDGWALISDPARPGEAKQLAAKIDDDSVVVVSPERDFRVLMDFIRRCYLIVTPDTSFSHAASAMGVPILNLMIGENMKTWAPVGVPHRIVASIDPLNLRDLAVADVLQGFDELLSFLQYRESE